MVVIPSLINGQSLKLNNPIVDDKVIFLENDGMVTVEAEYFNKQSHSDIRQWYITAKEAITKVGRDEDAPHHKDASNSTYLEILPDTRVTHSDKLVQGENFSTAPGKMGVLHYKVRFNNPGRYYVCAELIVQEAKIMVYMLG